MNAISAEQPLILASGSRYRAELLRRLQLPFEQRAAEVDETPQSGEAPAALAQRLARSKALTVALQHPQRWVLGSDQVCACEGRVLGKPGTGARAREQLAWLSGRSAGFFTALALVRGAQRLEALDVTRVRFRTLDEDEIARYLAAEAALDCAGSFKCEGLGISLCESIESSDPTGLVGLPLIATARLLRQAGARLP
jgi:septum formation protein